MDKIDRVIQFFRNIRFENASPYAGYYSSREKDVDDEHEKENHERNMRMKYGKKWRERVSKEKETQPPLRKGEVRKWNPKKNRYDSNLD